ncbi:MAG: error-prone DNA polymerase [Planctomycetota bacterium]
MPENEFPKLRPHPAKAASGDSKPAPNSGGPAFAELMVTSNFTFLTGGSHPEELVERAAELGHCVASIADTNTLAGVVRAHVAAKRCGIPLAVGSRLRFGAGAGGPDVIVYPIDRESYSRLCRLLTLGKRRAPKGECHLTLHDLIEHSEGLLAIIDPPVALDDGFIQAVRGLESVFADRLSLAAAPAYLGDDAGRLAQLADLAAYTGVPLLATNRALYHVPERRALQDVLTCIRHGCTIERAGHRLEANAERHLKEGLEMERLFEAHPRAVARALEIAERASAFGLDELKYRYPAEPCPPGLTPTRYLEREVWVGAKRRYSGDVPKKTSDAIRHELALIEELGYEAYFLTCYDIVRFARSQGILCQGRGGAANSAVCYCLGITEVDPAKFNLLFERFVSRERAEPPDIDIDFEHERREEVLQYIYAKYGRERAALTAEVISYRGRSAIREVGKAMGLPEDCVDALAKNLDRWGEAVTDERVEELGLDPSDPVLRHVIRLASELAGFPRHLSQHVGGFVITQGRLENLVPIENAAMDDRTVIEWDKDDIDAMGMLKVDCLGLGMMTCIGKAFDLLGGIGVSGQSGAKLTLAEVIGRERSDDDVYDMISHADTVGVFQIESRAQMSMLPRLKPRCFYDLVIEVAIVRPGPIQGGMVHPYLRRREGVEPVSYPSPDVEDVLGRTLGVPLFQEQAMQLAIVAAGFTPDEADGLRRAMAAWKRKGNAIARYGAHLIEGMVANGYDREFAERCFDQIKGFSEYGFPESHAASFALLVYVSAWLKRYHPAAFVAALINSQPMGFYQPAQLVRDAQEHGVEARVVDVNESGWDCRLEVRAGERQRRRDGAGSRESWGQSGPALRLGMRLVKGLSEEDARKIEGAVEERGRFGTVEALWRASGVSIRGLRCLARADAFGSMRLDRQKALWQIRPLRDDPMPLFVAQDGTDDAGLDRLPAVAPVYRVLHDYASTGLSLKEHPVAFLRDDLAERGVTPNGDLRDELRFPSKKKVSVAGVVLCRQRPGTASGVTFITLEDETGIANLVVWKDTFEKFRRVAKLSTILLVQGTVERQGEVVHVHVAKIESLDSKLPQVAAVSRDFH